MNKNNKSGHPVVFPNSAAGRPGSYTPIALITEQLVAPWNAAPGVNTMYCSDCHGNDTEINGDPKGPHGSDLKYLLKGNNHSWPVRGPNASPADGSFYILGDLTTGGAAVQDLFCNNCHDTRLPHTYWANQMLANNRDKTACIQCHIVVPHGSPVSRLMGYNTFPEPYNYTDATFPTGALEMSGFAKTIYTDTDPKDVWAPNCGGASCHRDDKSGTNGIPYDPNLMP
jgi:hypothetical protein